MGIEDDFYASIKLRYSGKDKKTFQELIINEA